MRFVKTVTLLILLLYNTASFAQNYILNGSATQNNCNCYTLTTATMSQSGSVWNKNKIDLTKSFDFHFNVNLGCQDANGADGIVFMLQPLSTSVGSSGSGMGFQGVSPSVGIALDTWQNIVPNTVNDLNDPPFDHISIQANGVVRHGNDLAEPIPASATSDNIEDCNWHVLRIVWNAVTKQIVTYFDGVQRVSATVDMVQTIFNGDPMVYWGFSGSTGGSYNIQQFCTALNPDFKTNFTNNGTCIGNALSFTNTSESFAPITNNFWNFGDGTTATAVNPPPHLFTAPGVYPVKLAITGLDGCKSDTMTRNITIGSIPDAAFNINDTCFKAAPLVKTSVNNIGCSYQWLLNGNKVSTQKTPSLNALPAGSYSLKSIVTSDYGCGSSEAQKTFIIKEIPSLDFSFEDVCIDYPTLFKAVQKDAATNIIKWNWSFGDNQLSTLQNPQHIYNKAGDFITQLYAQGSNGCLSDTIKKPITIVQAHAFAGNDTIVLNSVPFYLNGSGEGAVNWLPATGLSRDDILKPQGVLTADEQYVLTVTTHEGCTAADSVKIEVFKGSAVYVPTAFTPNGNGLNDVLKPKYVGIKKLFYFTIYNRWGQKIFTTNDTSAGWDGRLQNKEAGTGSFVWMLQAEDIEGKVYHLKGVFTLIR